MRKEPTNSSNGKDSKVVRLVLPRTVLSEPHETNNLVPSLRTRTPRPQRRRAAQVPPPLTLIRPEEDDLGQLTDRPSVSRRGKVLFSNAGRGHLEAGRSWVEKDVSGVLVPDDQLSFESTDENLFGSPARFEVDKRDAIAVPDPVTFGTRSSSNGPNSNVISFPRRPFDPPLGPSSSQNLQSTI